MKAPAPVSALAATALMATVSAMPAAARHSPSAEEVTDRREFLIPEYGMPLSGSMRYSQIVHCLNEESARARLSNLVLDILEAEMWAADQLDLAEVWAYRAPAYADFAAEAEAHGLSAGHFKALLKEAETLDFTNVDPAYGKAFMEAFGHLVADALDSPATAAALVSTLEKNLTPMMHAGLQQLMKTGKNPHESRARLFLIHNNIRRGWKVVTEVNKNLPACMSDEVQDELDREFAR